MRLDERQLIASRDKTLFHQNGIFNEPISKRSRNPNCKAWRTKGSGIMVKLITPLDSAAKRSGLPPAVIISGVLFRIDAQPSQSEA